MRPVLSEMRRAIELTLAGFHEARGTGRSHPGWFADPHLRRGWLTALPVVGIGLVATLVAMAATRSFWPYLWLFLPVCLFANVLWFVVSARSRSRT